MYLRHILTACFADAVAVFVLHADKLQAYFVFILTLILLALWEILDNLRERK